MTDPRDEFDPHADRGCRVAVTGIGLITPFGCGRERSWERILTGAGAIRRVEDFLGAPSPLANDLHIDPVIEMATRCADEAVADAGLVLAEADRNRIGCVIGTSKPLLRTYAAMIPDNAATPNGPSQWTEFFPNQPALAVSRRLKLTGPCLCPVAACATGLVCLQRGHELIRDGDCDVVLAGSSDASLLPIVLGSFQRLGVLAKNSEHPAKACRPFDLRRNGFVIGEGAAVFVLERLDKAIARGTKIYAEWLAGGMASDGSTLTGLDVSGESLARLITDVLKRADVQPQEIDYINLHGTATEQNDIYETRAVKSALGRAATAVSCSSLKGAIGHLLGAAGSVEMAATLLALRDGIVPPTVNLESPDPACDLDYTPRRPKQKPLRTALKLSLGFGGHLAAAVVRKI